MPPPSVSSVKPSLSLILPVRNAQRTLAADIGRILDVLPDLARKFEIVVVDRGSHDHTREVAEELAMEYPQVRIAAEFGENAIPMAAAMTRGETVIAHDGDSEIDAEQLLRLCREGRRSIDRIAAGRRKTWRIEPVESHRREVGFAVLDAEALTKMRHDADERAFAPRMKPIAATPLTVAPIDVQAPAMTIRASGPAPLARPNYLLQIKERLKNLALGE